MKDAQAVSPGLRRTSSMNSDIVCAATWELTKRPAGLLAIAVIGVKSLGRSKDAVLFWMRSMVCASEMTTPMV